MKRPSPTQSDILDRLNAHEGLVIVRCHGRDRWRLVSHGGKGVGEPVPQRTAKALVRWGFLIYAGRNGEDEIWQRAQMAFDFGE